MRLILASASPRRAELLTAAGFVFEILAVDLDERITPGESPREYARRLASEKSAAALNRVERGIDEHVVVLGADTTVVLDDAILGKPADAAEAKRMLKRLSGRRHEVLTGVSLRQPDGREVGLVESTTVFFSVLGDADVDWYVQTGEGRDKAGAYAIQGLAARFIPRIEGSYSNVVGLPIAAVHELRKQLAALPGLS